jgi:hypothetical protein
MLQRNDNIPDMLRAAGVPDPLLPMAQQYAFFLPRTCDPYAQGVQLFIQAIQNVLASKGADLEPDGGMGIQTVRYVARVSGRGWPDKTWVVLLGEALAAPDFDRIPLAKAACAPGPQSVGFIDDLFSGPAPYLIGAVAAWWFFFRPHPQRAERRARARHHAGRAVQAIGRRIGGGQ